jgi:hypothetical protein
MKRFLAVLALVIAVIVTPLFFLDSGPGPSARSTGGPPWQIGVLPDGTSKVFGLTIGASTLADARSRLGSDMQLAIVAAPGEAGSLEVFYTSVNLGSVTGKLILTGDVAPATVAAMRERAVKTEYMEGVTRKSTLRPEDQEVALRAPIRAVGFIPSIDLDEDLVRQRFGPPAERIRSGEHVEHLLYPDKGLDLVLDARGKEFLQYVAPRAFAHLREPLVAARAATPPEQTPGRP